MKDLRRIFKDASRCIGGLAPLFTGLAGRTPMGQSSEKARPFETQHRPESGSVSGSRDITLIRVSLEAALRAVALTVWMLGVVSPAHALTAPGTLISNIAYVSYNYPAIPANVALGIPGFPAGTATSQPSNRVDLTVAQVSAFTLTSSQSRFSAPNATVYFYHTLTNAGNGNDTFDLSCATCAPSVLAFYADMAPSDGVPDSITPITSTGSLAPGQSFNFVAVVLLPPTLTAGQTLAVDIQGRGNAGVAATGGYAPAVRLTNTDTVQVTDSNRAVLSPVSKKFSVSSGPSPSISQVTVTITYTNNAAASASTVVISDWIGIKQSSPVTLDTTGFRYVTGSARWSSCNGGATVLTEAADGYECPASGPKINFSVTPTPALSTTSALVSATIDVVPAFTSGYLQFDVQVISGLPLGTTFTTNAAQLSYCDRGEAGLCATQTVITNQASYAVIVPGSGVDLQIAKSVSRPATGGNFTINNSSEYTLQVTNTGSQSSSGVITVTDTLPGGLEVTGISASGWTCTQSGTHTTGNATGGGVGISCTTSAVLYSQVGTTPGAANPIRVTVVPRVVAGVLVLPAAPGTITRTNTASVAGGNEPAGNAGNNTGSIVATVGPSASVSGRVWQDVNHNRVWNAGVDNPLPGWKVEVFDLASFNVVATGTTATAGAYTIGNLIPGPYGIRFRDPDSNIVNGRPTCGVTAATCSLTSFSSVPSALDSSGAFLRVNLAAGDEIREQNLPLDPSGIVYDSVTGAAVAGAKVALTVRTLAAGNPVAAGFNPAIHIVAGAAGVTQTTGANGFYQYILTATGAVFCAGLPGGGCVLELAITPAAGYQPFTQSQALFPPQPSTGVCVGPANCIDAPAGPAVFQVSTINVAPILPVGQPYYMRFFLSPGDADVVNNHFPLIPTSAVAGLNLLVSKTANKTTAELGDFVGYTVRVFNGSNALAAPTRVTDVMPAGFKYVPGSSRLLAPPATTAVAIADPSGGAGPTLVWPIGTVTAGGTVTLTYRAQLSLNAMQGDGINRVSAAAPGFGSNVATFRVRVLGGVFSDKGFIVGTVFADCNRDRVQGPREPGIPGVRLYMEDGTSVVTDSEGKFSLYGISPRTHVMKIDDITLPQGSELIALNNRNAGDPSSRFVDVKKGEMVRADFAEGSCSPEVMLQIKARREKGETAQAELNRAFTGALSPALLAPVAAGVGALPQGNVGASAAKPVVGAEGVAGVGGRVGAVGAAGVFQPVQAQGAAGSVNSSNSNLPPRQGDATNAQLPDVAQPALSTKPLEELIVNLDNSFAILNLNDGDTLPTTSINVQLKGMLGATFTLLVNGNAVSTSRIGKRSTLESKAIQAWEYIGLTLKAGPNEIIARQADSFGNLRGEVKLKVVAPGTLAKIVIDTADSATADGATPITVKVRLVDDQGTLVTSRTSLTLQSSLGRWLVQDLNPLEPGTQVFISGGTGEFKLAAPADPGDANIEISGGVMKSAKKVSFLPHLRPLIGAGIIEGAINFNSLSLKNLLTPQNRDNFEQTINRFHYESGDGKRSTEARAAMFLKGKVKGDYLLTLAYDSDKDLRDRVFRDISPDEFYPIYGDSSARSFDGQTSGRFYVRVDKEKSFVLYGDYPTAGVAGARALSQFSRSLTGAKWHLEGAPYAINAFASRDTFRQMVQEFAANGTSGPFLLSLPSGSVINSEKVEVLTRDRNQTGLILKIDPKARFSDYEIEPYAGRLLFKAPVASLDANFNPQSIRITYEVDQGGTSFWVGGVDAQFKVTDRLEIGGAIVKDQNPGQEFSMGGLNATWKIFEKTVLVTELARTNRNAPALTAGSATGAVVGAGNASRIELRHADGNLDARVFSGRSDTTFDNPSSTLSRGRTEAGARATYKLTPSTNLSTEFLRTGDRSSGATRDGVQLRADHSFSNGIRIEGGVRHTSESNPAAAGGTSIGTTPNEFTSLLAKVTVPVPGVPQASVNASYEQSIKGDDRKAIGFGGEYKLSPSARLYGRYESINSLSGSYGLTPAQKNSNAVFGIDTKVTESTQIFTEYRGRSSLDGATSEASMGVRNTWAIAEGLRVTGSLERLQPIQKLASGTVSTESTAITGGIEYTANPLWKGSARLELRNSSTTDSVLSTVSLAYKLSRDWALLTRNTYSLTTTKGATPGDQERWRFQTGAAYRDTDSNKLSALARYEHRQEKDTVAAPSLKTAVDIASFHFNYQPQRSWVMSGRYATKYVTDDSFGLASKSSGQLISGRMTYDITSKWDIGVIALLHGDNGFANRKTGIGLEAGYQIQENMWLSAGYNLFGFKDKDLAGQDYTDKGFYVRLRYKFDETLFDWNKDAKLRNGAGAEQK